MLKGIKKYGNQVTIINLEDLSTSQFEELRQEDIIDKEVLAYAQDENETSFVEETEGRLTVVYQLLDKQKLSMKAGDIPQIEPMTFLVTDQDLFILHNNKTAPLLEDVVDKVDLDKEPKHILFQLLTLFTKEYFTFMEGINAERDYLIKDLRRRPNRKNLKGLANLQSGSVYILMGAMQNSHMLDDIKDLPNYNSFSHESKEQLRDTMIEAKQLSNMCSLHSRILEQLASSYNNVLSNNLNENVTTLTIISIGISLLATVTSFYGMNVKLPFAKIDIVWFLILLITSIVALISIIIMKIFVARHHNS
ncbi:magnesium transporter CorA family protein [Streptococcus didelphis]|uniref:Magnesium transporter CorA family protein n=1 Tax=Streptococcus didelphis TaxID=102886 RepID=A0ABY9LGM0_9STRE|nr:magnesium transporter CorA family protein [Streptococcus didelphis]WMB28037.1 magnesium transporter CorA family protein [Streptococcus didelphis]WMB29944.1 magnesium transporter CorA family protein [Streptococcus didelphis]